MKNLKRLIIAVCVGMVLFSFVSCKDENTGEKIGKKVDEAAEQAGKKFDELTDKLKRD